MTLISTINDCIGAVTWTNNHDVNLMYFGTIFNKFGIADWITELDYQNDLNTTAGYVAASMLIGGVMRLGLTSSSLTTEIKETLNGITMFTNKHLPINYVSAGNWFLFYRYDVKELYRASKLLGYLTTKWDSSLAWQEIKEAIVANSNVGCSAIDPTDNGVVNISAYIRFYDEQTLPLMALLDMYEVDRVNNAGALTYATDTLWAGLNTSWWSTDYYKYALSSTDHECESSFIGTAIAKLRALNGYSLTNWANITTELETNFLTNNWDSIQWTFHDAGADTKYYAVVHGHTLAVQRRLENVLGVWTQLHAFYDSMSATDKAHVTTLLDGATKAWEYLIGATAALYVSADKRFKYYSDDANSGFGATAVGLMTLFLMGIVPDTGSLYVPLLEGCYQGHRAFNNYWNFDYTNHRIRIPVHAGSIKFIYGSTAVTKTFPSDGVYDVVFANDWNSISKIVKRKNINKNLLYVEDPNA